MTIEDHNRIRNSNLIGPPYLLEAPKRKPFIFIINDYLCRALVYLTQRYIAFLIDLILITLVMAAVFVPLSLVNLLLRQPLSEELVFVVLVILTAIILRRDSRFILTFGILGIISLPFFILVQREDLAERLASLSFLLLITGVSYQTVEFINKGAENEDDI